MTPAWLREQVSAYQVVKRVKRWRAVAFLRGAVVKREVLRDLFRDKGDDARFCGVCHANVLGHGVFFRS